MFSNNFDADDRKRASLDLEMHTYEQLMHNDFVATIASCTQTIERTANHEELATAYLYRGSAYLQNGLYSAAQDDLQLAISLAGKGIQSVHAFTNLGIIYYSNADSLFYYFSDNLTRAHEALSMAISLFPYPAIFPLPYIYRSIVNAKKKIFADALSDINLVVSAKCFDHNNRAISLAIARINFKSEIPPPPPNAQPDFNERTVSRKFRDDNFGSKVFAASYEKRSNPNKFLFEKYNEAVDVLITFFPWDFCKYVLTPECSPILRKTVKGILYNTLKQVMPDQPQLADFFLRLMNNERIKQLEFNPEKIILNCTRRAGVSELKITHKIARARRIMMKEIDNIILQQAESYPETARPFVVAKIIGDQQQSVKESILDRVDSANGNGEAMFKPMAIIDSKPSSKEEWRAHYSQRLTGLTFFPGILSAVPIPQSEEEKEEDLARLRSSNVEWFHPLI